MGVYKVGRAYYFQFRFRGQRIRKSVGAVSKRLAQLAEDAERRRVRERWLLHRFGVADPAGPNGTAPTLEAYVRDTYLPTHLPRLEPSSQQQTRSLAGKLVRSLPRGVRLDELGPAVLDPWAAKRLAPKAQGGDGVSAAQVVNDGRALSAIINHARRQRVITAHPMHGWKWPTAAPPRFHVVTIAEEAALLRAARGIYEEDCAERPRHAVDLEPWIVLGLATGLRKDELRRLDVDHHVDVAGAQLRIPQPKVKHRVKEIPLEPPTLRIIARLRRPGVRALLAGPSGRAPSIERINRVWRRVRARAGLRHVRFNDLRHTFATRALEAGGTVPEVGEMLGHKAPHYKMTWRYVHARPEGKRAAIRNMLRLRSDPRKRGGER